MAELLFVLVTVYVAYVVTTAFSSQQKTQEAPIKKVKETVSEVKKEKTVKVVSKSVVKKQVAVKKTKGKAKVKAAVKTKVQSDSLRHPETGEVVKIANTYRMTKRWIKEALVTEGLLEKIYKTNEIDDVAKANISKAIDKLSKMKKYQ